MSLPDADTLLLFALASAALLLLPGPAGLGAFTAASRRLSG